MSALLASLLLTAATPAATPDDFAWQWPVLTGEERAGVYRLTLDDGIYRHVVRTDLGDLVAFDATGQEVPFGPVPARAEAASPPLPATVVLNWFAIPREATGDGGSIELHLQRDADGTVRLDADVPAVATAAAIDSDILVDASALKRDVVALELALALPDDAPFRANVDVLYSNDLRRFILLDARQTLLVLRQDGRTLQRLRIPLPPSRGYLLLRRTDGGATLPVSGIVATLYVPPVDTRATQRRTVVAAPVVVPSAVAGEFHYGSGGPFPVERLTVSLAQVNGVADVVVESRDDANRPWREQGRVLAFRVSGPDGEATNLPIDFGVTRDRWWRVRTMPPQADAPRLEFQWRADQFLLMAQGQAPYRVAAGSTRAMRDQFPLSAMLRDLRRTWGESWEPPHAVLGERLVAGDEAVLQPATPPLPWRTWLLWGVLVAGALGVTLMVFRLLRQNDALPPDG